ncbi:hypothetical protein [uncultured Tateyamaria sp.]|uniref:hypothetical protein n=1 Tax=uncultured Tateyamaria sp. TaxID=455651 RepID=UPI0026220ECB|nr:hypothetical protein [uncultured Tateyamaria sp.]
MSNLKKIPPNYPQGPFAWGVIGTVIFAFLTIAFLQAGSVGPDSLSNWQALSMGDPNNVGDTLAGLAGSLALFWIIITAWQQSIELREQREIIADQRDIIREQKQETALQRVATQEMAQAMKLQSDVLKDERRFRDESRAAALFEQYLETLQIDFASVARDQWKVNVKEKKYNSRFNFHSTSSDERSFELIDATEHWQIISYSKKVPFDERLRRTATQTRDVSQKIEALASEQVIEQPKRDRFEQLKSRVDQVITLRSRLSDDQALRLDGLGFHQLSIELGRALELDIWSLESENKRS